MEINEFLYEIKKLNIDLDQNQLKQLEDYYNLLIEENKKVNLTRITNKKEVYLKHFYDSLTLYKAYDLKDKIRLCDIGTGAGFPGIVLKIAFPNLEVVLIDSLQKRINFLNKVINELGLKKIVAIHDRVENYSKNNKETFDVVTSRAVARSEILIEICIPLLKKEGHLILMKANCNEEVYNLKKLVSKYKSLLNRIIEFELPIEKSARTLIDIKKKDKTPEIYPRSIDKIKKDNLK